MKYCEDYKMTVCSGMRYKATEINFKAKLLMESLIELRKLLNYIPKEEKTSFDIAKCWFEDFWKYTNNIIVACDDLLSIYNERDRLGNDHIITNCKFKEVVRDNFSTISYNAFRLAIHIPELKDLNKSMPKDMPELTSECKSAYNKIIEYVGIIRELIKAVDNTFEDMDEEDREDQKVWAQGVPG
jgi:hypothetical protein